ncbi:DUF3298 and DUF4163 domain-containing protein [Pedobacter nutrimenti]|uniref:Uncharacterized protein DUF4163 n=1 Tax=Pedobacter nutrimenti TaxID=1241337 RepID=A0A318UE00_9SPHI|nr:DUF3298 and DUF4163 domain-containing protein [Pedobacter nutrimenti]PYF72726.1 uncharacterized protein DUF4163 [Pedobacter nutrimenti]
MKKIAALLIISGIMACQSEKKGNHTTDSTTATSGLTDTLTFKYDSVKVYSKLLPANEKKSADTSKASVRYPVFTNKGINTFVQTYALKTNGPDEPQYKSYKEMADGFIKGFDDYKKDNKEDQQAWFKQIEIRVLPQRKNYLPLEYTFIDYAGGAHPNSAVIFENYNTSSQHRITLDSLIDKANMPKLTKIAEKIFRKNEHLTSTQSLANSYFFEKNTFSLNHNFTVTDKGLKFLYNPYEIKAYAAGRTELLIPFEDIKDILKPNSILPALK